MEEKLREAACFGDLEGLVALLEQGADVDSRHKVNGWTALHWAAKRNNLSCVETLLSRGADKLVYTSKGELAAHLTTDKRVLQVLGYSGQRTKERPRSGERRQRTPQPQPERQQETSGVDFMPNYLRHPPINYKVDLSQVMVMPPKANKRDAQSSSVAAASATLPRTDAHLSASSVQKARSANHLDHQGSATSEGTGMRILKVRLVGREEYDSDFIEVDLPTAGDGLTFRRLIDVVCEEFSLDPKAIVKVRKLPNTRLRRDVEIARLRDYQELEVVTTAKEDDKERKQQGLGEDKG